MVPDNIRLKEIKPALTGYIRESQTMLRKEAAPGDKEIHDVRVLMKKSRAALKLAAPQLDKLYFDKDLESLREVGIRMCSWREASVLRKELKKFRKEFPEVLSQLADNERIIFILSGPSAGQTSVEDLKSELQEINSLLSKTGYRIRFETMSRFDPHLLLKQLEVTYNNVVEVFLACRHNQSPVRLHKFRKRAKDFLYQLCFFRPLNPEVIKTLEKRLDRLTQNLGRYNNLSQLIDALDYGRSTGSQIPAMHELVLRIREKQDKYLSLVWPEAFKMFCPGQNLVNLLGFKLLII